MAVFEQYLNDTTFKPEKKYTREIREDMIATISHQMTEYGLMLKQDPTHPQLTRITFKDDDQIQSEGTIFLRSEDYKYKPHVKFQDAQLVELGTND